MCVGLMVVTMGYTAGFLKIPIYGKVCMLAIGLYTTIFVLSRPSKPRNKPEALSEVTS